MFQKFRETFDLRWFLHHLHIFVGFVLVLPFFLFPKPFDPWNMFVSFIGIVFLSLWLLPSILKGDFLTHKWFRENGIRTEAVVEGEVGEKTIVHDGIPHGKEYTVKARGFNPVTNQEQIFSRPCEKHEIQNFSIGIKCIVYLHPKRTKWAYRMYIDPSNKGA